MAFLKFLLRRLAAIPITLLVITAALYGIVMLSAPEERASLYFPPRLPSYISPERMAVIVNQIIAEHHLDDPYWRQYGRWVLELLRGDWGYSPTYNSEVLPLLRRRALVTAELTLYTLAFIVPLGLVSGVISGWRELRFSDHIFRALAFIATALPPFILGIILLSIFYVGLYWFLPGRTSFQNLFLPNSDFVSYTGFITLDGLLNGRLDVTLDAFRHLALPVVTLGLLHWATLGRITRAAMIEEKQEDYVIAARARGLTERLVIWRHAFRNAMLPAFTSSVLSAASLITGAFVVEIIFNIKGLSEIVTRGMEDVPDAGLALGFAVFSVLIVIPIMILFDVLKALVDPRISEEEIK